MTALTAVVLHSFFSLPCYSCMKRTKRETEGIKPKSTDVDRNSDKISLLIDESCAQPRICHGSLSHTRRGNGRFVLPEGNVNSDSTDVLLSAVRQKTHSGDVQLRRRKMFPFLTGKVTIHERRAAPAREGCILMHSWAKVTDEFESTHIVPAGSRLSGELRSPTFGSGL